MITASGAGAAFIAVPPKRLKPKPKPKVLPSSSSSVNRDFSAASSIASRHPHPPHAPASPAPSTSSTRLRHVDPALTIESLLTRSRLSISGYCPTGSPGPRSLLEVGIEEDEWTRGFVTGDDFLSSLWQDDRAPSPRPSAHISTGIRADSPSGRSSTSTVRAASAAADSPPIGAPVSTASSRGPRKLRRTRPNSHPSSSASSLLASTEDSIASPKQSSAHHGLGISSWNFGGGKASRYGERRLGKDFGKMSTVRDINIAVVGAAGVGKTTFIERAYDLPAPVRHGEVHSLTMVMDRTPCNVSLVDVDWNRIDFDKEQVQWPRVADGQRIPFIDGVLLLFDTTHPRMVDRLTECLEAFDAAQLPVCLVRTKCDIYGPTAAEVAATGDGYDHMQSSITARDSQKRCMAAILSLISRRNEKTGSPRYLNGRRRANSSAANSRAASPRPSTGHNRASSEFVSTFLKDGSDAGSIHGTRLQRPPTGTALGQSSSASGSSLLPDSQTVENLKQQNSNSHPTSHSNSRTAPQITLSCSGQTPFLESGQCSFIMQKTSSQSSLGESEKRHSYMDTDDEGTDYKDPDDIPILDREDGLDELDEEDKPVPNRGWTWDELINRLLSQPMSRSDETFVTIFLCFYRKFASPRELLTAIIERFRALDTEKIRARQIPAQLRYCGVLHQWVTSHTVDFASSKTRMQMLAFLDSIGRDRSLALLTTEMAKKLQEPIEDEDESWGRTDAELDRKASLQSFLTTSSATFPDKSWQLSLDSPATLQVPGSDKRSSDTGDAVSVMGPPIGLVVSRTESLPPPVTGLLRAGCQFEHFMSIPVSEVASELTRLDWNEFSKIRPRDLVRHISVSPESRENSPNLACVNNMISHFNHVAHWVASVILEKAKPKHRARALEKFMEIAWTLRHQNNYNSLGAIIAGINGTAIHRLSVTRELVKPEIHKNFMRLDLLMGTHKSHSKYRLAWENTTSERIPFLPLHRRDLVSAEEGNKTFLQDGEKINWSKFQVMGEVMMVLVKAQASPYKDLVGNPVVDTMIKSAATVMNDDDLYERSVQLEGSATGSNKSRRNWFQLKTNIDQR